MSLAASAGEQWLKPPAAAPSSRSPQNLGRIMEATSIDKNIRAKGQWIRPQRLLRAPRRDALQPLMVLSEPAAEKPFFASLRGCGSLTHRATPRFQNPVPLAHRIGLFP
ncbi:MAG: hypothetical protein M2R45_01071 [Verrucomicrobia subdivision 3 bacterium]|nr:hypothetical protein [Limisphaerales bacterium]MCS1414181.1 hypothetical protein [Limisphaerales bacterium]